VSDLDAVRQAMGPIGAFLPYPMPMKSSGPNRSMSSWSAAASIEAIRGSSSASINRTAASTGPVSRPSARACGGEFTVERSLTGIFHDTLRVLRAVASALWKESSLALTGRP